MTAPRVPWVASALFLDPDPDRLEALARVAADPAIDWSRAALALALHGVLPLVRQNLLAAGVKIPPDVEADLATREIALREDARRARLTLVRFLAAAEARGIEVVLLKGASLALDLYRDPAVREQMDVDVLVEPARLGEALSAAKDAGLSLSPTQLPVWWYRLVHFHVTLQPAVSLMKKLEIHWHLHSAALLLTIDASRLRARAREVRIGPFPAWTLDPVDRFLHLATHLASHWRRIPEGDARLSIQALLDSPAAAVPLKWVLDLASAAERLCQETPPRDLLRAAAEWSAEAPLAQVLDLVVACPVSPHALAWVLEVQAARPAATSSARRGEAAGSAHVSMHFRLEVLDLLPRWIWPPTAYICRRYAVSRLPPVLAMRLVHAVAVVLRAALAAAALPVALLCRRLLRRGRRLTLEAARRPARLAELARGWSETETQAGRPR